MYSKTQGKHREFKPERGHPELVPLVYIFLLILDVYCIGNQDFIQFLPTCAAHLVNLGSRGVCHYTFTCL